MQKVKWKQSLICIVFAAVLLLSGCTSDGHPPASSSATPQTADSFSSASSAPDTTILGEGDTQFLLSVADKEQNRTDYEIHTNQETVGAALLELGLIAGEEGPYGLYVTTVGGITLDFSTDGSYWAFYIDGEYAVSGVDSTPITPGASYSLRAES